MFRCMYFIDECCFLRIRGKVYEPCNLQCVRRRAPRVSHPKCKMAILSFTSSVRPCTRKRKTHVSRRVCCFTGTLKKELQNQSSILSQQSAARLAEADAKRRRIATIRNNIKEVKRLIDDEKASIRRLIEKKRESRQASDLQSKLYRRNNTRTLPGGSETAMDNLSYEFEQLVTYSEVDSDEEWLAETEALEGCLDFAFEDGDEM